MIVLATSTKVALPDPPEVGEANPIHSADGAAALGYAGAVVAGVSTYGWACTAVVAALGERWLEDGWADVRYRAPVFAGDELTTTVSQGPSGRERQEGPSGRERQEGPSGRERQEGPSGRERQEGPEGVVELSTVKDATGQVVLVGTVGLGEAPWFAALELPEDRFAQPEVAEADKVRMLLESAPVGKDFRPMVVDASANHVRAYARTRLGEDDPRYLDGDAPRLHPSFLAARMTPLFRHTYLYGPAIHARTQIQHLAPAFGGQELTVAARLHAAYERKGHHYHESDCVICGADGTVLAAKRHTGIFKIAERS